MKILEQTRHVNGSRKIYLFGIKIFSYTRKDKGSIMYKSYYSQYGQDAWILDHFKNKTTGFFVDIGAHNGVLLSNTKKMEELGWRGVCIEPNPPVFKELKNNRPHTDCYEVAVGIKSGTAQFVQVSGASEMLSGLQGTLGEKGTERLNREAAVEHGDELKTITVKVATFDEIMTRYPDVKTIDYISIDTEGNEFDILKSIDFNKYNVLTLSVENNYHDSTVVDFMVAKGYDMITCECDDIYFKK